MALLKLEHISFHADAAEILEEISFTVETGEMVMLSGPSGSGKSTLLKIIGDLLSPTAGTLWFREEKVADLKPETYRRKVAYVFQIPHLFGASVRENLEYPAKIAGTAVDAQAIGDYLKLFQLEESVLDKRPTSLSGGEKQRIALIRTLLMQPEVLLLDEVTASLDEENAKIIEETVCKLKSQGITILWVTHDPRQLSLGTRSLTLKHGKVVQ